MGGGEGRRRLDRWEGVGFAVWICGSRLLNKTGFTHYDVQLRRFRREFHRHVGSKKCVRTTHLQDVVAVEDSSRVVSVLLDGILHLRTAFTHESARLTITTTSSY